MSDPRLARLFEEARRGRLTRRRALSIGLRLGLSTPAIAALMAAAPEVGAAPAPASPLRLARRQAGGSGTLTVVIGGDLAQLDPNYAYDEDASRIFLATHELLLQYKGDTTDQYDPMLARSWEANADGSVYTFSLAPNATFSDGSLCDANAVKAAFGRIIALAAPPYEASVARVTTRFVGDPSQIEVVDAATVRFNLGRPQPLFLAAMASSYGPFIVNPAVVEANKTDEDPLAQEALTVDIPAGSGSGPYQFVEYLPSERLVLRRYEGYHGGWEGDEFEEIVFRIVPENATRRLLLEQGDADALTFSLTPNDVEAMRTNPDLQVLDYDTTRADWVIMNVPRLKTVEARQGLSFAFPYQEVIDSAYRGLMTRSGPIPATVRGSDPNVFLYQTDLARAKELILAGGFAEGDTFEYIYEAGVETERTASQLFQANLAQIGFDLTVTEVETATLEDLVYGDMPAEEQPHFIGGWAWWPDYNDPWNQLDPNFTEASKDGGGSNAGDWVNPRFEEIMAEAATSADEARLVELMREAQQILTELDPPCIYLGQSRYYTILRRDIQGYQNNPLYLGSYPFYRMSRAAQ